MNASDPFVPPKKILVTGASGRIGSAVVKTLLADGFEVRATDRHRFRDLPLTPLIADLRDPIACYHLAEGMEAVVHLGNHPNLFVSDPQTVYAENLAMNINVFQAAVESGVKKIIFASSVQAMTGHRSSRKPEMKPCQVAYLPLDGNAPANPDNAYGLSKQAGENMLRYFSSTTGIQTIALRFPVTIADEWAARFKHNIRHPQADLNVDEVFSYLLASDAGRLVAAILRANLPGYRCYFPSAATPFITTPVPQLVAQFHSAVPCRQPVDTLASLVDISGIEKDTGWKPLANLDA